MKTCAEIRHANLLALIEQAGSIQAVADKLEKEHAQISQLKTQSKHSKTGRARVIGDDTARLIEEKFGLEVGWMDNSHDAVKESRETTWPFREIGPQDLARLSQYDVGQIEGFAKGLLSKAALPVKRNGTHG